MKKLILVTGDLATGKSTFAGILSRRYNTPVIYKDKVKEVLGDTIGFSNREENLKLSKATMSLMTYAFSEAAKLGKDLILEANFKEAEMAELHKIAKECGYEVLTLLFKADMDIIYRRFINRIENENRHPVHLSGFDGYDDLKYYIEIGRKQEICGRFIEINADDFSYQTDKNLFNEINAFLR